MKGHRILGDPQATVIKEDLNLSSRGGEEQPPRD